MPAPCVRRWRTTTVVTSGGQERLLSSDPERIFLSMRPTGPFGILFVSAGEPPVTTPPPGTAELTTSIQLGLTAAFERFTFGFREYGTVLREEVWALITQPGGETVEITEIFGEHPTVVGNIDDSEWIITGHRLYALNIAPGIDAYQVLPADERRLVFGTERSIVTSGWYAKQMSGDEHRLFRPFSSVQGLSMGVGDVGPVVTGEIYYVDALASNASRRFYELFGQLKCP